MNMLFLVPAVVLVLLVLLVIYARRGRSRSGLGDRNDATERPELRGTTQWNDRNPPAPH